jgi:hypothetical protein
MREVTSKGVKLIFISTWFDGLTKLLDSMSGPQTKERGSRWWHRLKSPLANILAPIFDNFLPGKNRCIQTDFCVQIKFLLKPLIKLPEMMVFDCQELYICRYDTGILNVSVIGCEVCSGLNDQYEVARKDMYSYVWCTYHNATCVIIALLTNCMFGCMVQVRVCM